MVRQPPISALNRTRGTLVADNVRVARTHWSRLRGLIGTGHADFPAGQALWVLPCRGVHTCGIRFPLDLIYLDKSNYVIDLRQELPPWSFGPFHFHAASVMELPAGTIRKSRTEIGDKVEIVTAGEPEKQAA